MSDTSAHSVPHRNADTTVDSVVTSPPQSPDNTFEEKSQVAAESTTAASTSNEDPRDETVETSPSPSLFQLLRWRRSDRVFIGTVAILALVLMSIQWIRLSGWGTRPIERNQLSHRQFDYRIDINKADWIDWVHMEGIGETLATRIVEDRDLNGPFESIDELQRVKGIGPKTVEKLRPWMKIVSESKETVNAE